MSVRKHNWKQQFFLKYIYSVFTQEKKKQGRLEDKNKIEGNNY